MSDVAPEREPLPTTLSEGEITALVQARHTGNGWLFWRGLGDGTGSQHYRTIDAFAMGVWPSLGYKRIAYEIKSSRTDWLRELHNPDKRKDFYLLSHEAWFVLGPGVLLPSERRPASRKLLQRVSYDQEQPWKIAKRAKFAPLDDGEWERDQLRGWGILEVVPQPWIEDGTSPWNYGKHAATCPWKLRMVQRASERIAWPMPPDFVASLLRTQNAIEEPQGKDAEWRKPSDVSIPEQYETR